MSVGKALDVIVAHYYKKQSIPSLPVLKLWDLQGLIAESNTFHFTPTQPWLFCYCWRKKLAKDTYVCDDNGSCWVTSTQACLHEFVYVRCLVVGLVVATFQSCIIIVLSVLICSLGWKKACFIYWLLLLLLLWSSSIGKVIT